jgi:hypothetical protein
MPGYLCLLTFVKTITIINCVVLFCLDKKEQEKEKERALRDTYICYNV